MTHEPPVLSGSVWYAASQRRELFLEIWYFLTEEEKKQTKVFISGDKNFVVADAECVAIYP